VIRFGKIFSFALLLFQRSLARIIGQKP
jgi:hypothetical protein